MIAGARPPIRVCDPPRACALRATRDAEARTKMLLTASAAWFLYISLEVWFLPPSLLRCVLSFSPLGGATPRLPINRALTGGAPLAANLHSMVVLRSVASLVGLIIGGQVELALRPARRANQKPWFLTTRCDEFSLTVTEARHLLPVESFSLEGERVQLGWKWPALLLAPLWLLLAPKLLPVLLCLWLGAPGGPKAGTLEFDAVVRETDFGRGLWPAVWSDVLSTITRSSLPALLVELAETGGAEQLSGLGSSIPASQCAGASVVGSKLVFEGRLPVRGQDSLEYTVRTGVKPRRSTVGLDGALLAAPHSTLCFEEPELRLSLGDSGLRGMLPKMWVPIQSATGVKLPPSVWLRRAAVSEAVAGLSLSGVISLDGKASPAQDDAMGRDGDADGDEGGGPSRLRLRPAT